MKLEEYKAGRKFIINQPCHMVGLIPRGGGAYGGFSRSLKVGEIVVCKGYGAGWGSDPGYGIHWEEPGIAFAEIEPQAGGMFDYRPKDGLLTPID